MIVWYVSFAAPRGSIVCCNYDQVMFPTIRLACCFLSSELSYRSRSIIVEKLLPFKSLYLLLNASFRRRHVFFVGLLLATAPCLSLLHWAATECTMHDNSVMCVTCSFTRRKKIHWRPSMTVSTQLLPFSIPTRNSRHKVGLITPAN